ncbi:ecto-ADP-ribosyltransferase 5-like [Labeo rohita]|uniref:ecto-ADP-ribosyltransferase 5-like n=1 Tax=Labeo rohita TaxID=84645 RepID=UPI0021E20277|nr:ecto-ADP-ribosyltransferase 5-like [Labeo rohita]XP_050961662.1 ecto-ADP-ribosyltransferase 5-like [Labeo rohita]XP_050961663.1 ecto-ADP-ribosyltransferase 5-like [Labeo rohita]XP_050961664.1 ecto-ADP-ribosyltransferase 5-like [Labeo rohita]XP_050961665.1 ecto-ADP-ribosyltransferase 5-like [Labeo rohita]XP_050961666.1 ecto-ADP-ribosyltransferase 5-like [Labeo rohita]XP_050961667.1 ecto-ADP-ribosyltransferase 5-like [Labeo rohita]
MRLIIEALLILAALEQDHRAAVEFPLDMALNSVDDQYEGCRENMTNKVETDYLQDELNKSSVFKEAWQEGENKSKSPEVNLTRNHSIAIYVYTNSAYDVYGKFNEDVRSSKQDYANKSFKWYSLHFLLTDAIKILKLKQKACFNVTYRGTNVTFVKNVLNNEIRFGQFTSSSLNRNVTKDFGNTSCFEIYTCEGVYIANYSKYPEQEEVLIPPYETFKVTAVKNRTDQPDLWCDTVYMVKSSGKKSYLNCGFCDSRSRDAFCNGMNCALCNSGNCVAFLNILLILTLFCKVFTC